MAASDAEFIGAMQVLGDLQTMLDRLAALSAHIPQADAQMLAAIRSRLEEYVTAEVGRIYATFIA